MPFFACPPNQTKKQWTSRIAQTNKTRRAPLSPKITFLAANKYSDEESPAFLLLLNIKILNRFLQLVYSRQEDLFSSS